jgi:hypothetical protein
VLSVQAASITKRRLTSCEFTHTRADIEASSGPLRMLWGITSVLSHKFAIVDSQ